ncbi:MAG: hypothetical protein NZ942_00400, partial [Candidatus Aenigmarchaeota archaeon]|nr:hypothetical protein [Candidatus Aenigmarchaeota archaeon]
SNYWHIPRISYDVKKMLGNEYLVDFLSVEDPTSDEEIKRRKKLEVIKSFKDKSLLYLGYGKMFYKKTLRAHGLSILTS